MSKGRNTTNDALLEANVGVISPTTWGMADLFAKLAFLRHELPCPFTRLPPPGSGPRHWRVAGSSNAIAPATATSLV